MYKRTIGSFALATALFMVLLTSTVPTRAAGTPTGSFIVQATVNFTCSVKSTENVNFGSIQSPIVASEAIPGSVTVDCPGALFWVFLGKGTGAGATFAQRKMTSTSNPTETLIYSLYMDPQGTTVWGDGSDGSGNDGGWNLTLPRTFPFWGIIAGGQAPAAGSYQDTIVVTLSF